MKAFPFSVMTYEPDHPDSPRYTTTWHEGMDLRDYFAIKVLAAYQSNPEFYKDLKKGVFHANDAVIMSYDWADAMLEERDK